MLSVADCPNVPKKWATQRFEALVRPLRRMFPAIKIEYNLDGLNADESIVASKEGFDELRIAGTGSKWLEPNDVGPHLLAHFYGMRGR